MKHCAFPAWRSLSHWWDGTYIHSQHMSAGLVCFREGSVIAAASLDCFGGLNGIMEEAVAKWMREQQVLHTPESLQLWAAAQRQGRPRQAAGSAGSNSDEGGSDWQEPCDVCGRCYPHQHIRSMYGQHYSDSDSDND